ncbi:MAG TPA: linear amide C-N hydrolase [Candidatus Merdivicinus excrementipullorum]|uniref:Linear amide C-N hydrolase n=1 Tax=Candidatus Merdivicinus excrementipullorum TaxID=2840867 RepID=A0A9D1JZ55_9FIRM|nr:linear amide C-N hydrolase [Candidatus Merdivicinus excrementipullorum]
MSRKRLQKSWILCLSFLLGITMLTGCGGRTDGQMQNAENSSTAQTSPDAENVNLISPTLEIVELENGFSAVRYDGDTGFDQFLAGGGASSDGEVVEYLANNLLSDLNLGDLLGGIFGCSTIAVQSPEGDALFGRNFDWENCEAMVVESHPENGYASLSTVNMDFITQNVGGGMVGMALNLDEVKTLAALYAPLDGMNEAGLAVSVNMIQDSAAIQQNTDKPDITTTTAIRLLLDQAGNVDEALELLGQYDLHGSMGMMIHFAIADSTGRSVAVEYVDNEMTVIETPVLTNFYLAEGEKYGIGTEQSHERYDILMNQLEETPQMGMEEVRDALDSVSKDNFGEFESTEWSIVMNLSSGEARYYHRENYNQNYTFRLES